MFLNQKLLKRKKYLNKKVCSNVVKMSHTYVTESVQNSSQLNNKMLSVLYMSYKPCVLLSCILQTSMFHSSNLKTDKKTKSQEQLYFAKDHRKTIASLILNDIKYKCRHVERNWKDGIQDSLSILTALYLGLSFSVYFCCLNFILSKSVERLNPKCKQRVWNNKSTSKKYF